MSAVRLWVALDVASRDEANRLLDRIASQRHIKVGMELFYRLGPGFVRELVDRHYHVFLDLKCHDIPRTVGRAVAAVRDLGVEMLTVHAAGGLDMLQTARQEAGLMDLVAVTVLTSLDHWELARIGLDVSVDALVEKATRLAADAGLAGVVASAGETGTIRQLWPGARIVVPGLRLPGDAVADQRRVAGPGDAVRVGATDLVVGRPITESSDPEYQLGRFLAAAGIERGER